MNHPMRETIDAMADAVLRRPYSEGGCGGMHHARKIAEVMLGAALEQGGLRSADSPAIDVAYSRFKHAFTVLDAQSLPEEDKLKAALCTAIYGGPPRINPIERMDQGTDLSSRSRHALEQIRLAIYRGRAS